VDEFFFGQFVDAATKVMKAVTLSTCSKTTAAGVVALSASLQRLIDLMMACEWCGDAELQKQVSWCLALLQPSRRHVYKLGEAMDKIGKGQPPSLLAPYTGFLPGKAIIQSAMAAYEARG
jgi:hypothetical protein